MVIMMSHNKQLSIQQKEDILEILKDRFVKNPNRHKGIEWTHVLKKLEANPEKLWSINEMELTGGEPDVVGYDDKTDQYHIYDCSAESPKGRRSYCYDHQALEARKEHKPDNSAMNMAMYMGIEILNEEAYRKLQSLGNFDMKTSSWLQTPEKIRKLGGAIFGDYRFETIFIYHNGAESYYAARGFRGAIKV